MQVSFYERRSSSGIRNGRRDARRLWDPPALLGPGEGVFPRRTRELYMAWVCATLPIVTVLGAFVHGERAYLVSWVLVGALYATPALFITWVAGGRAPTADRRFWRLWWLGLLLVYVNGAAILLVEVGGLRFLERVSGAAVVAAVIIFAIPLVEMMRSRSGERALSLDVTEGALALVAALSLAPLLVGERVLHASAAWFTIPAAITTVGLICAACWAIILFVRLNGEHRVVEALGVALALVGALNAGAQVAQGITNFALPTAPLLALQAACTGLILITPLHLPRTAPVGLNRLPPQQQVRKPGLLAALPLVVVPLLAAQVAAVGDELPWAAPYAVAVVALLLVLSTMRHILGASETRRLYAEVERAADQRRLLLADVMAAADMDRHRVAAQLHEQATSTFVALTTYARAAGSQDASGSSALQSVRADLEERAEGLRRLMVAVRPLQVADKRPSSLAASITAYVHSLYGDAQAPVMQLQVDGDLELDWSTETITMRILQEALRNTWQHADAGQITVAIGFVDDAIELQVSDDGCGFDPDATMFESGIDAMRTFAAFAGGAVEVLSTPGAGTTVLARLGVGAIASRADGPAEIIDLRDAIRRRDEVPELTV